MSSAANHEPVPSTRIEPTWNPVLPSARFSEQVSEVVERILVSLPKSGSNEEVRIQLKSSILDGCEIRVFRNAGAINVVFMPSTEAAQQFLMNHEAHFQATLADRLGDNRFRIEIDPLNRGQTPFENHDGRSRQRYVPEDDETASW